MIRRMAISLMLALSLTAAFAARGQDFPSLQKLDDEVRQLNQKIAQSIFKAQLPMPNWMRDQAMNMDPMRRWNDMVDPQFRQMLEQWRDMSMLGGDPGWMSARFPDQMSRGGGNPGFDRGRGSGSGYDNRPMDNRGGREGGRPGGAMPDWSYPNSSVIVLDDQGYILAPLYIESQACRDNPAVIYFNDEKLGAKFVGSDHWTQFTVFKLDKPIGKSLALKGRQLAIGSLVLSYYPLTGKSNLAVWNGPDMDIFDVFFSDGTLAGIVRYNQFLASAHIAPVANQLIVNGKVNRATLGVKFSEFTPRDSFFRKISVDRPGIIVDDVAKDSLSEKAGFKKNDVVYELNDQPVVDLTTWAAMMAAKGESQIKLIREGKKVEIKADFSPPDKPEPEKPQPPVGRGGMGGR